MEIRLYWDTYQIQILDHTPKESSETFKAKNRLSPKIITEVSSFSEKLLNLRNPVVK